MDQIDKRILRVLQVDGKLQNNELAQRIGLSASPCLRRVKQLEEDGIIRAYVALVDPAKVNLRLTVFARIWLKSQDPQTVNQFVESIREVPEVVECHLMAGDCDFFLRIVVADLDANEKYIFDNPILVKYVGMGHGVLFILFLIVLFVVCEKQKWSLKMFILGLIASILPFGPFVFDAKIKKLEPEQAEA